MRLLVVEDNPAHRRLMEQSIRPTNDDTAYELVHVGRLADAVQQVAQNHFDLVLLDLMLPDSRGLETFERFSQVAPNLPVVVTTAVDDDEVALRAMQAGAQDYLVKSHDLAALLARSIRYAIERHRAEELAAERARLSVLTQAALALSHHVRNAVAPIITMAEIADLNDAEDMAELRELALEHGYRITAIVDALIEMAESGSVPTVGFLDKDDSTRMLDMEALIQRYTRVRQKPDATA